MSTCIGNLEALLTAPPQSDVDVPAFFVRTTDREKDANAVVKMHKVASYGLLIPVITTTKKLKKHEEFMI